MESYLDRAIRVIHDAGYQSRVYDNLLSVLKCYINTGRIFADRKGEFGLGMTQLSRETDIPKSTCKRLVQILQELELIKETVPGHIQSKIAPRWILVEVKEPELEPEPERIAHAATRPLGYLEPNELNELNGTTFLKKVVPSQNELPLGSSVLFPEGSTFQSGPHLGHKSGPQTPESGPQDLQSGPQPVVAHFVTVAQQGSYEKPFQWTCTSPDHHRAYGSARGHDHGEWVMVLADVPAVWCKMPEYDYRDGHRYECFYTPVEDVQRIHKELDLELGAIGRFTHAHVHCTLNGVQFYYQIYIEVIY